MNESYIKSVVEAALLAAGRPLQIAELARLFDEADCPGADVLRAALAGLEADYADRGIEVKETATGFRIQVRRQLASEISRLWPERPPRYSRALLETLALIAYRQPITRAEIEAVRGVAVNPNIIKTLLERSWVRVVGLRDVPGRPELLGTTKDFLDYFGLRSLEDLPPLAELKAMGDINLQLDLTKEAVASDVPSTAAAGNESEALDGVAVGANEPDAAHPTGLSAASDDAGAGGAEATGDPAETDDAMEDAAAADDAMSGTDSEEVAVAMDDADAADDAGDEDELSAESSQASGELVAAPRSFGD